LPSHFRAFYGKKFQPGEEIGAIELVAFEVVHELHLM
jgi:hypothetical protein